MSQAYDNAINDLTEVAEQQAGRSNKIDDLMAEAERVRVCVCVCVCVCVRFLNCIDRANQLTSRRRLSLRKRSAGCVYDWVEVGRHSPPVTEQTRRPPKREDAPS